MLFRLDHGSYREDKTTSEGTKKRKKWPFLSGHQCVRAHTNIQLHSWPNENCFITNTQTTTHHTHTHTLLNHNIHINYILRNANTHTHTIIRKCCSEGLPLHKHPDSVIMKGGSHLMHVCVCLWRRAKDTSETKTKRKWKKMEEKHD